MQLKRTERGFAIFGEVTDSRRNVIRAQESSACGGPYLYLFTHDSEGRELVPCVGTPTGMISITPHLTQVQARKLAKLLLKFADADSPAPGVWQLKDKPESNSDG